MLRRPRRHPLENPARPAGRVRFVVDRAGMRLAVLVRGLASQLIFHASSHRDGVSLVSGVDKYIRFHPKGRTAIDLTQRDREQFRIPALHRRACRIPSGQ